MKLELGLLPEKCNLLSFEIAKDVNYKLQGYTTTSVERAILRLFGLNTGDSEGIPNVNKAIENLNLSNGALYSVACYITKHKSTLSDALQAIVNGETIPEIEPDELSVLYLRSIALNTLEEKLKEKQAKQQPKVKPLTYLIVATGNIYEDAKQAYAAAVGGADIIAVIRSTAQSLLDYVPIGLTTEGFGGTFATYENFVHVRKALDKAERETGKRKYLTNYASGLCMPEIAVCGAIAGLDMLLNDSMYGILFRDINPKRTLIDQFFSRKICAKSGIIINTGEDNYLTTSDAIEKAYTVTASQFINRSFAHLAGMPDSLIGLGHAFEIDPTIENSMVLEIAHAMLTRNLFPNCPIKYMPPTKHKCGDIFFSHAYDTTYNLVSVLTEQDIHLVGMLTEAIHTPFLHDRMYSLDSAQYVFNAARSLGKQLNLSENSEINKRANFVLEEAFDMLSRIKDKGLFETLETGEFAGIKRPANKGKGYDGVITKSDKYLELL